MEHDDVIPETEESGSSAIDMSKRLTHEEWEDAKLKWRSGAYTLKDLSEEFGISDVAFSKRLKRHGVEKGVDARAYEQKKAIEIAKVKAEAAARDERELRETATNLKRFLLNSSNATVRSLMGTMAKQSKDGKSLSYIQDDAKAAKEVTIVLKNIADVIDKVVPQGVADMNDLPELSITELTPEQIEDAQNANLEEELALMGIGIDGELSAELDKAEYP